MIQFYPVLDNDFVFLEKCPEFARRASLPGLERPVEIAQIVESAAVAYLTYAGCAVDEHPCRVSKPDFHDVFGHRAAGIPPEKAAECRWRHSRQPGKGFEPDRLGVVDVNESLYFADSPALFAPDCPGE